MKKHGGELPYRMILRELGDLACTIQNSVWDPGIGNSVFSTQANSFHSLWIDSGK